MKNKLIIVEGMDRCGKDTLIKQIKNKILPEPNTLTLHFSNPPSNIKDKKYWSILHYDNMFKVISKLNSNIILNRSHLGEYVYSPLYRNENADWIFSLEEKYYHLLNNNFDIYCVCLVDEYENLTEREDGLSLSMGKEINMKIEKEKFSKVIFESKLPYMYRNVYDLSKFTLSMDQFHDNIIGNILNARH